MEVESESEPEKKKENSSELSSEEESSSSEEEDSQVQTKGKAEEKTSDLKKLIVEYVPSLKDHKESSKTVKEIEMLMEKVIKN